MDHFFLLSKEARGKGKVKKNGPFIFLNKEARGQEKKNGPFFSLNKEARGNLR